MFALPYLRFLAGTVLIASAFSPLFAAKPEEGAPAVEAIESSNSEGETGLPSKLKKIREEITRTEHTEHSHREQFVRHFLDSNGAELVVTNTYTVLESGMHYQEDGQWKNTEATFEEFPSGFVARHGPHKAIIARRLGTQTVVDLLSAAGHRLQSAPHFLAYQDKNTGQQQSLARVRPVEGQLVNPNTILFEDAFDGILADVRVVYKLGGLECDVVLRQQLPDPTELGLDPLNTVFQVYTEFTDTEATVVNSVQRPRATKKPRTGGEKSGSISAPNTDETDTDDLLSFGDLHLPTGTSFPLGNSAGADLPNVRKAWTELDGRKFLIEQIDQHELVKGLTKALPEGAQNKARSPGQQNSKFPPPLQPAEPAETQAKSWQMRCNEIALVDSLRTPPGQEIVQFDQRPANPGYVVDWTLVTSTFDQFTFATGQTYFISGTVNFLPTNPTSGPLANVRFEPDVVIKYAQNTAASICLYPRTTVDCATEMYRPAHLVPVDDNTVGEIVSGSTGIVTGTYANPAIRIDGTGSGSPPATYGSPRLRWLRIKNAELGVQFILCEKPGVINSQFLNCNNAFRCNYTIGSSPAMDAFNCLIVGGANCFSQINSCTINASCLTLDITGSINSNPGASAAIWLGNSIVLNTAALPGNVSAPSPSGNFITPLSRSQIFDSTTTMTYCLSPLSSTIITGVEPPLFGDNDMDLRRELSIFKPKLLTGTLYNLPMIGPWNTAEDKYLYAPGYRYPVIDYIIQNATVPSGTLIIKPGTRIGFSGGPGLTLADGTSVKSWGTGPLRGSIPTIYKPGTTNVFIRDTSVGEQSAGFAGSTKSGTYFTLGGAATVDLRFTQLMGGTSQQTLADFQVAGGGRINSLSVRDCVAFKMGVTIYNYSAGQRQIINFKNNLLYQCSLTAMSGYVSTPYPLDLEFSNNLVSQGSVTLTWLAGTGSTWNIRDNVFSTVTTSATGIQSNGSLSDGNVPPVFTTAVRNNAYYSTTALPQLSPITLSTLTYTSGDGWPYYIYHRDLPNCGNPPVVTMSSLYKMGSRSISAAGLFHYTTGKVFDMIGGSRHGCYGVVNDKAGNSPGANPMTDPVDIGPYTYSNQTDYDNDFLADAIEDSNGNGTYEPTVELSDWTHTSTDDPFPQSDPLGDGAEIEFGLDPRAGNDTDGDGASDWDEVREGTNPRSNQLSPNYDPATPTRLSLWEFDEQPLPGGVWLPRGGLGLDPNPTIFVNSMASLSANQRVESYAGTAVYFPATLPGGGATQPLGIPLNYTIPSPVQTVALASLAHGSIQFTYSPDWLQSGGTGAPGAWCTLLDGGSATRIWRLSIDPTGTYVVFQTPFGSASRINFQATLPRNPGLNPVPSGGRAVWRLSLNYSSTSSSLEFIPSSSGDAFKLPVTTSGGIWPGEGLGVDAASVNTLVGLGAKLDVGTAINGAGQAVEPALGWIEDLEIFNCVFSNRIPGADGSKATPFANSWKDRFRRIWCAPDPTGVKVQFYRHWETSWPTTTAYVIERRPYGTANWTTLATNWRQNTYIDTTASLNTLYEYRCEPDIRTAYGVRGTYDPGYRVIVVVDKQLKQWDTNTTVAAAGSIGAFNVKLSAYLAQLSLKFGSANVTTTPIEAERMNDEDPNYVNPLINPTCFISDPNPSSANSIWRANCALVKQAIQAAIVPGKINLVVLIGHVPVPMAGNVTAGGHDETSGAKAADVWYGDSQAWDDSISTFDPYNAADPVTLHLFDSIPNTAPDYLRDIAKKVYANTANDGKWTNNVLPNQSDGSPGQLEAAVGRIDFARMPYHKRANESLRQSELRLTAAYLDKVLRYRNQQLTFSKGGYSFAGSASKYDPNSLYSSSSPLDTPANLGNVIVPESCLGALPAGQYVDLFNPIISSGKPARVWGFHGGYGGADSIQGYRQIPIQSWQLSREINDLARREPASAICIIYGSYFADWYPAPGGSNTYDLNQLMISGFMRSVLAAPNSGLVVMSLEGFQPNLRRVGIGAPVGVGQIDSFKTDSSIHYKSILGDPTLTF